MAIIETFSRINLPREEVFKFFLEAGSISNHLSPLFKIENFNSSGSLIDKDTYFVKKCILSNLLQLFVNVDEIVPGKKIIFNLNGLIKGKQTLYFIEDESSCLLREKTEVSLYDNFNLTVIDLLFSLLFNIDSIISHLKTRRKISDGYKIQNPSLLKEMSKIRTYISINADKDSINSVFKDFNKFMSLISAITDIKFENKDHHSFKIGPDFFPQIQCNLDVEKEGKIRIKFQSPLVSGVNIWEILPCENEFIIENSLELENLSLYMEVLWIIFGNLFTKEQLKALNSRLKEIVENIIYLKPIQQAVY